MTRIKRNAAFAHLTAGYLFPEIAKRRRAYAESCPGTKVISLGVGNTTEPLLPHITEGLRNAAQALGTRAGYSGYGEEGGSPALRRKIAEAWYHGAVGADDVFVSDGAKPDIGRLQLLFGREAQVAVQDPAYPVYVDGSVLIGAAGGVQGGAGYAGITYMPCTEENGFFPDLRAIKAGSIVYFCSPNNPTGAAATEAQLASLVGFARESGSLIVFDAAYAAFIRDETLPRTIFAVDGAAECAIEVNSFSKPAGFTGVRLGWTVVPKTLRYADGAPVQADWQRVMTTIFNEASNVAQAGGIAALDDEGRREMRAVTDFYLENARIIADALAGDNFRRLGAAVHGTGNSPYLWVRFPGRKSWDVFDAILHRCSVVTTPGSGFGPAGESYVRFSAFGHREDVAEAAERLRAFSL